jgi:hypothetical protein
VKLFIFNSDRKSAKAADVTEITNGFSPFGLHCKGTTVRAPNGFKTLLSSFSITTCFAAFLASTGCDQAEIVSTLGALNTLAQSKALAEQFVRDEKSVEDPGDPGYRNAMSAYEDARDAYNNYLTALEVSAGTGKVPATLSNQAEQAQTTAARFLTVATRSLKPDQDTRSIQFDRAVTVPADLCQKLHKLPAKQRNQLLAQYDGQLRWLPWGHL